MTSHTAQKALKLVDATDAEAVEEFKNERAIYEEITKDELYLSFAMRYFGAYDLESAYCGSATELGEPVRGWSEVDRCVLQRRPRLPPTFSHQLTSPLSRAGLSSSHW